MEIIKAKHFYSFGCDTLIKGFVDESVMEAKYADAGAKDIDISVEQNDEGYVVNVQRAVPTNVPASLKAFLGEWNNLKQSETWTGSAESGYRCELSIEVVDVPVAVNGTMEMTSNGLLTTNNVEFQISSDVPLFGGQVEKLVYDDIKKTIEQEFEYLKGNLT